MEQPAGAAAMMAPHSSDGSPSPSPARPRIPQAAAHRLIHRRAPGQNQPVHGDAAPRFDQNSLAQNDLAQRLVAAGAVCEFDRGGEHAGQAGGFGCSAVDAPGLDPLGQAEEEGDGRSFPQVLQRERARQRDGHGGEHVEAPLVAQPGERAYKYHRCADCRRRQREVGEGVLVPPRAIVARPDAH
eukprot:scaffold276_cov116-Isochrysis_galbana.AAC.1